MTFSVLSSAAQTTFVWRCSIIVFYKMKIEPHLTDMDERQPNQYAVAEVATHRLDLNDAGALPIYLSEDLDTPLPHVQSVLVMLHGRLRDAAVYYRTALAAVAQRPGWLVVVPQFLAEVDITAHDLPARTLRWSLTGWMGGDAAVAPSGLSTFAVLDALLVRLGAPALRRLVVAGHSGGAQIVQRYALVGDERADTHYVVANPSSYAFLDRERPEPTDGCPDFDSWKYGLSDLPAYANGWSRDQLAARYAKRNVTYLLGGEDTDPAHPALDNTDKARCQGPHRRARGEAFYADLKSRFPNSPHQLRIVPGIGHNGSDIFTSADGIEALFG
jgi:pimeloyl-ACP methyl ester carboxylesterase